MPGLFHSMNVEKLELRRESVDREIDSLLRFRRRIEARIAHIKSRKSDPKILSALIERERVDP